MVKAHMLQVFFDWCAELTLTWSECEVTDSLTCPDRNGAGNGVPVSRGASNKALKPGRLRHQDCFQDSS